MTVSIMYKVAGIVALFTTICKVALSLGVEYNVIQFVAANAAFFYGVATGVAVASLSRNLWVVMAIVILVFVLLKYVGW